MGLFFKKIFLNASLYLMTLFLLLHPCNAEGDSSQLRLRTAENDTSVSSSPSLPPLKQQSSDHSDIPPHFDNSPLLQSSVSFLEPSTQSHTFNSFFSAESTNGLPNESGSAMLSSANTNLSVGHSPSFISNHPYVPTQMVNSTYLINRLNVSEYNLTPHLISPTTFTSIILTMSSEGRGSSVVLSSGTIVSSKSVYQSSTEVITESSQMNVSESNSPITVQETTSAQMPQSKSENEYLDIIIGRRCSSDKEDNVWWNETDGGMLAVKSCPSGYQGSAYRPCYSSGKWGGVDYSECRLESLKKIKHLVTFHVNKRLLDGLHHIAEEFEHFLTSVEIRSPLDRIDAFETLILVLRADLELSMDKQRDVNYVQTLLQCTDELLTRKNVFFSFQTEKNHLMTQKAAEVVSDLTIFAERSLRGLLHSKKKQMTFRAANNIVMHLYRGKENRHTMVHKINSSAHGGRQEDSSDIFHMDYALGTAAYALLWIRGIEGLLNTENIYMNSDIAVATSIPPFGLFVDHNPMAFEVNLRMKKENDEGVYILKCGTLWNATKLWKTDDCIIVSRNRNMVRCRCSHLGSIALVLKKTDNEKVASPIKVGKVMLSSCIISLVTVILSFIIHTTHYRRDPPDYSLILLNLLISMASTQIVFMAGINATKRQELCYSVALILHYLFLVSSFWLVSFGIHLYRRLRHDTRPPGKVRDYCILSWVVPIALVIVSFTVNPKGYETTRYCWLSIQRGMLLSFIVPVTALILVNTVFMVLVLKTFNEQIAITRKTEIHKTRTSMRAGVTLLPFFAVNWFFGVLAVEDSSTVAFQFAFAFTNSLQGILVFVFYCVMDVDIRHSIRNKFSRNSRKQRLSAMKLRKSCSFPVRDRSLGSLHDESRRPDSQPLLSASLSYSPLTEDPCCSNIRV